MRIVGGALSGRTLPGKAPEGTRPTSDRAREAIASALEARGFMHGAVVLDLYAGTGALGLEALSWGARSVIAIDSSPAALRCIRDNATALGLQDRVRALKLELGRGSPEERAERIARQCDEPITLVFADPPYADGAALAPVLSALAARGEPVLAPGAAVVVEHASKLRWPAPDGFDELARYRYGDTAVWLGALGAPAGSAEPETRRSP